jgi:hypothetical protein
VALTWVPWNVAAQAAVVVGSAGVVARGTRRAWIAKVGAFARELAIVLALYALWRIVGVVSLVKVDGAVHAGERIWDVERLLHLPSERVLQLQFMQVPGLIRACNAFYAAAHLPSMFVFLLWLWFRHNDRYPPIRNVIALTTLWCLAIQLIPVAPPRLVPPLHVLDTPALYHQSVYPEFGANGPAQLSAMPSVHVAWAVLIGIAVVAVSSSRWRWFFLAHPLVTTLVVVVTGNHYWLDGIVGVAVLALAFLVERGARAALVRRFRTASRSGTLDVAGRYEPDLPPAMSR